jgi:hypothetical protein
MDFKSLINKIDSMDSPVDLPKAPTLPKSVQLNEDAELRVLSGRSTVLAETELMEKAVSKSQQKAAGAALAAKRGNGKAVGASKDMMKMSVKELEKIAGTKHKGLPEKKDESVSEAAIDDFLDKKNADKNKDDTGRRKHSGSRYGGAGQKDDAEDDKPEAKKGRKTAKESIELDIEEFNDTFSQMVEAAKKAPAKKAAVKKTDAKGAMNNMFGGGAKDLTKNLTVKKKDEKVKEGAKPDFLDLDGDGDTKEPMKKAAADKKKGAVGKKDEKVAEAKSAAQKAAQEKFKAMVGKKKGDTSKKTEESKMMPKGKKRPVKESTERKLSFKQMIKLVQESGGQQQIDPKDQELFDWAQRVARTKLGEDAKAEIYAGLVYERMGGRFEMYDVLNEDQKKRSTISEASDYMNDLVKFTKVVRSVETPEQLKVAQRMGQNLLQKYRNVPSSKLDQIGKALGHDISWQPEREYDVEDEIYNKKKELDLN